MTPAMDESIKSVSAAPDPDGDVEIEVENSSPSPPRSPPDRELRIALVCYGGVSLAVYMHGISREILKLVRASAALHDVPIEKSRQDADYPDCPKDSAFETDTEAVYLELLQDIGPYLNLRVVVDTIAGASAGGINGIMLARALAYDLPLEPHRKMWLELADVIELINPKYRAKPLSKLYLHPFLWATSIVQFRQMLPFFKRMTPNPEIRRKLSLFMRSRWFKPPFSGERMSEMMLDGVASMGSPEDKSRTLLPQGHRLELFVTTTDFYGHRETLNLHDPETIEEREHRHVLTFSHLKRASGDVVSDFGDENAAGLAFAARATSCFPGAFPPAAIREVENLIKDRSETWPERDQFIEKNFADLIRAGHDPRRAYFIDGSVLINKPFGQAIRSIQGRAAHREVDRRIVYIDPNPDRKNIPNNPARPGFFSSIKGALSDIPRNQPIRDDLEWLEDLSAQLKTVRQVVEVVEPEVRRTISRLLGDAFDAAPDMGQLRHWRHEANALAAKDAGYAYHGYVQLKIISVLEGLGRSIRRNATDEVSRTEINGHVMGWAETQKIFPVRDVVTSAEAGELTSWVRCLRDFDVDFRIGRLRFVVRRLNLLYRTPATRKNPLARACLNGIKASLYRAIDQLMRRREGEIGREVLEEIAHLMTTPSSSDPEILADKFDALADAFNLRALDDEVDAVICAMSQSCLSQGVWRALLVAYLGYPFFDVLTFPIARWRDMDELDDIKVDRISPEDATAIRKGGVQATLKGIQFAAFGAFFSREFRENDYLWGRLHGAERMIDIVLSCAEEAIESGLVDPLEVKRKAFRAILMRERQKLTSIDELLDKLDQEIAAMRSETRSAVSS
ncbi:MAG: patatin-like protein [Pseudomonadota bacterium]